MLVLIGLCLFAYVIVRMYIYFSGPRGELPMNPEFVLSTVFVSNFIGIVFARSLHYQFYCWYFHSLPYLLWKGRLFKTPSILNLVVMVTALGCVELCFNVYPATAWSSALLQVGSAQKNDVLEYSTFFDDHFLKRVSESEIPNENLEIIDEY